MRRISASLSSDLVCRFPLACESLQRWCQGFQLTREGRGEPWLGDKRRLKSYYCDFVSADSDGAGMEVRFFVGEGLGENVGTEAETDDGLG